MSTDSRTRDLTYAARARLADNLYLYRRRAGLSQERLGELALVCAGQIGAIERGRSIGMLDTSVRIAGALLISLDELLAGVTWTPGEIEAEIDAGYEVEFEAVGAAE